ncbi:MAG: tetratricopeptide repeat protein [Arcobacteraceae bacterium]|jgi:tetratricopeptide (TPR) repeat protein
MPSYFRLIFSCIFLFYFSVYADENNTPNDYMTIVGLDRELNNDFTNSSAIFIQLFEKTKHSEYLKKAIDSYMQNQEFEKVTKLTLDHLATNNDIEEYLLTRYVLSSMLIKQYKEALPYANQLGFKYPTAFSLGLLGDLNYILGNYDSARINYEDAYSHLKSVNIVIALSNVLYEKLSDKPKAIKYLNDFIDKNGCIENSCTRLLEYYQKENDIYGMTRIVEKAYNDHKKTSPNERLAKIELLLGELYMQVDRQKGINFLIETGNNDLYLVSIYEEKKEFDKALKLLNSLYKTTQDKTLLGRIAMVTFEMSKDKKAILKEVFAKFELALSDKSNPQYENFYGYLLIDYDLDIKKGLNLVQKANLSQPDDVAIMDSLAWGYFKNKQCDLAYEIMNKVVQKVGMNDSEIKLHYQKIKECVNTKNNMKDNNKTGDTK